MGFRSYTHKSSSANRLFPWLYGLLNSTRTQAYVPALMCIMTEAYFLHGDDANAEATAISLRSSYTGTPHAARVLPFLQLVAMNQRDSVKMNNAIAAMAAEGFHDNELGIARAMKRAYHRVIPKSMLPKTSTYGEQWKNAESSAKNELQAFNLRNKPNPFDAHTVIEYTLPKEMPVTLTIYSALGQIIAVPERGMRGEGRHEVRFTMPAGHPRGIYYYVLTTPRSNAVGRMLYSK